MSDCIFCKIVAGEVPSYKLYEDEAHIAFLSPWPNTDGFSIVIPKEHHSSDVFAMSDAVYTGLLTAAKKVASKLKNYYSDVGRIGLMIEGAGINHAHIKLMPMHGTGYMNRGEWKSFEGVDAQFYKTYPGYIISSDGPKADNAH